MTAPPTQQVRPAITHLSVLSTVATGSTQLSAFHRALLQVDLAYFNLVRLSSVVPPGVTVGQTERPVVVAGAWGDRLYCVFAEQRTSTPGEEAWAGVGWVHRLDGGGGMLVEHEGTSEDVVRADILASLADMTTAAGTPCSAPELVVAGGRCLDRPLVALVIVPFTTEPWGSSTAP